MVKEQPEIDPADPIKGFGKINFQNSPIGSFDLGTVEAFLRNPNGFMDLSFFQKIELFLRDKL